MTNKAQDYRNQWNKENLKVIRASYKSEFVDQFKEACKALDISQSQVIRDAMQATINKAKEK